MLWFVVSVVSPETTSWRRAAALTAASAALATVALGVAMVEVDPSLRWMQHTSTRTPIPYRIGALWGAMEGGPSATFRPELRAYEDQRLPTTEAGTAGGPFGDTIVVLESIGPDLVDQF